MEAEYKAVRLPSKCLVYPGVDPAGIQLRTLRGKDEKLIAEITGDNTERQLLMVLRNVLKGIDPAKLTLGDRLYILVWEVINSYDKMFEVEHNCTECFERVRSSIDLSQMELIELPDGFTEPYSVRVSTGADVQLRLLRVEDEIAISDYEKHNKAAWLYRYALPIAGDMGIWDRLKMLEDLPTRDIAVIRAFHDKFMHGPKMEGKYVCSKCGGGGVVPVPFRPEMLLPYGDALGKFLDNAVRPDVPPRDAAV